MAKAPQKILIMGASGSGTSTLGAALGKTLGARVVDADDAYWLPTRDPFTEKRDPEERLQLMLTHLQGDGPLVVSGSIVGWGSPLEDAFDAIVFLYVPADIRVERLRVRELERLGKQDEAFLEWAAQYDSGPPVGRSLKKHQDWLEQRTGPILRVVGALPADQVLETVLAWLRSLERGDKGRSG